MHGRYGRESAYRNMLSHRPRANNANSCHTIVTNRSIFYASPTPRVFGVNTLGMSASALFIVIKTYNQKQKSVLRHPIRTLLNHETAKQRNTKRNSETTRFILFLV